jgi:hypothetical protein
VDDGWQDVLAARRPDRDGLARGGEDGRHHIHHRLAAHLEEGARVFVGERAEAELRGHVGDLDARWQRIQLEEARERQVIHVEDLGRPCPREEVRYVGGILKQVLLRLY